MFVKCYCGRQLLKNKYLVAVHLHQDHGYNKEDAEKRAGELCS